MGTRRALQTDTLVRLRRAARWWGAAAVAGLAGLALAGGLPHEGEAGYWESLARLTLLAVYALSLLATRRAPMLGGAVLAVGATGVGVLVSLERGPLAAAAPVGALVVPAVLLWVAWQQDHRAGTVLSVAVAMALLLGGGAVAGTRLWDHFYGPQHPSSPERALPLEDVRWVWSGAVTPSSVQVRAGLARAGTARLRVTDGQTVRWYPGRLAAAELDPSIVVFDVTGLAPRTRYAYAVEVGGVLDHGRGAGHVTTTSAGPSSFTVAVGSCARLGSNGAVFDTIRAHQPDRYLITGDWFYADIADDDPGAFLDAYDTTLTRPAQAALYREVPIAYVWDDHDYGPNDADGSSPTRAAAGAVYRAAVPHGPLGTEDGPVYQAFTMGRVRFVLLDTRADRDLDAGTLLGEPQRRWLAAELASTPASLVVLVSSVPWITPATPGADHWGGAPEERRWLADLVADAGVPVLMVAGDAHMVAIDDGRHTGLDGTPAFPLLHAGALDRPGSLKGGPYSEGAHPGAGQFGLIEVHDDGGSLRIGLTGRNWRDAVLVSYDYTVPA